MSYCVNCGVELDETAGRCPLCQTRVIHPDREPDGQGPTPFPTRREEVPPVSKLELALLLSVLYLSAALSCGLLNLLLKPGRFWSLYVMAAMALLWIWTVLPLIFRRLRLLARLMLDLGAVAVYIYCVAVDVNGQGWFWGLALPILLVAGAVLLCLGLALNGGKRSTLSAIILTILSVGVFLLGVELLVDRWATGCYAPGWSLVVAAVCVSLAVPLTVVRHVPSLREEARRLFHL